MATGARDEPVDLTLVHPFDPWAQRAGGFDSFLDGFLAHAPDSWRIEVIGITRDSTRRPGRRRRLDLAGRPLSFLPVTSVAEAGASLLPLSLLFAAACRMRRVRPRGRVVQYQRFESIFAVPPRRGGRAACFLHNHPPELSGPASDVRWRGLEGPLRRALRAALARVDGVWAVDRRTPEWLRDAYPELSVPCETIPVWAEPRIFHAGGELRRGDRRALRSELAIEPAARIALFAGRLERQKDPETLLDAWALLADRRSDLHLLMVGDGRLRAGLERRVVREGRAARVHWLGELPRDRLAAVYRGVDVLVSSSAYESGPRVIPEALASGTPAVSFDVGCAAAALAPLADLDLVARPRTAAALAAAVERALEPPPTPRLIERCAAAAAPYTPARALGPLFEHYAGWGLPEPSREWRRHVPCRTRD